MTKLMTMYLVYEQLKKGQMKVTDSLIVSARAAAMGGSRMFIEVGKPVNYATHVFTVSNDTTYALPVTVPAPLADAAVPNETLSVRSCDGQSVSRALIDSVIDDPRAVGRKIIKLLVKAADLSAATRAHLPGMQFDVLLPEVAQVRRR